MENVDNKIDPQPKSSPATKVSEKIDSSLSKGATHAVLVDCYQNGVAVSVHSAKEVNEHGSQGDPFFLRNRDLKELSLPQGKFYVFRDDIQEQLSGLMSKLSKSGTLASSVIYFGVATDPFHVFHTKFANSMLCMDVFEKFPSARVVVQSRSKMILSALPLLKKLGSRAMGVIPLESHLDVVLQRYTSTQSDVKERLKTAVGLSAQGVPVCFSVSPILPYGGTRGDLWKFAEMLIQFSDHVVLGSLCDGSRSREAQVKKTRIAAKLEADEAVDFLRPDSISELESVIKKLSPSHLEIAPILPLSGQQLKLFAA